MQIRNFVNHALRTLSVVVRDVEGEALTLFHVKSGDSIAIEHDAQAGHTVAVQSDLLVEHTGQPAPAPAADTPLGRSLTQGAADPADPAALTQQVAHAAALAQRQLDEITKPKSTVAELEAILNDPNAAPVTLNADGTISPVVAGVIGGGAGALGQAIGSADGENIGGLIGEAH